MSQGLMGGAGEIAKAAAYGRLQRAAEGALQPAMPTMVERLQIEKEHLERRLSEINEALEALDAHPEVREVVEKLSKLGI